MTEPLTTGRLVEPSACRWCAVPKRDHMQRWHRDAGWHQWEQPANGQIKARMLARRNPTR